MLVMPINLLTPTNRYLGYIIPHAYHNPTMVVLKPLALVALLRCPRASSTHVRCDARSRTPSAPAWPRPLCLLAKPSYVDGARAGARAVGSARARGVEHPSTGVPLVYGILLPIAAGVGLQIAFASRNARRGGFVFAPLGVFHGVGAADQPGRGPEPPAQVRAVDPLPARGLLVRLPAGGQHALLEARLADVRRRGLLHLPAGRGRRRHGLRQLHLERTDLLCSCCSSPRRCSCSAGRRATPRPECRAGRRRASSPWASCSCCTSVSGLEWYGLHTGWLPMGYIIAVW